MARTSIVSKRIRPNKDSWKFATGTTKKALKEWEAFFGEDFVKYIEKKARRR